jgi:four helix bundle protein
MSFRFENLEIWKLSREFVLSIYKLTKKFPEDEKFGLASQLRRAAVSVSLNIVEGSDRKSDKEFTRFLRISLTSLEEVIAGLYLALDLGFIIQKDFDFIYESSQKLIAKIVTLVKKLIVSP